MQQRSDGGTDAVRAAPLTDATLTAPADARPPVRRSFVLSGLAIVSLGLTRLAYSAIVGHAAGKAILGRVNADIAIAMFATLLVSAGTAAAAAKFIASALTAEGAIPARRVQAKLTLWTCLGTLATVIAVFFCTSFVLPGVTMWERVGVAGLTAAYGAYSFVKGVLYGYGKVHRYAGLEVCADVIAMAATAALVVTAPSTALLLLPLVLGYGLFAVFGTPHARLGAGSAQNVGKAARDREMAGFTAMSCVGAVASTGFLQLSMVFARHYGSAAQAGEYASALALTAPAYLFPRALTLALFPAMASAYGRGDQDRIRQYADLATRLLLAGTLPFFVAAALLAQPLLAVVFGVEFGSAQTILQLLLLATFVSIIPVAATSSLTAAGPGLVKVPMIASVAGLLAGVALWAAVGPRWGVTAVAVGYLSGSVVQTAVPLATAWRHYRQHWAGVTARAALLCLLAAALWFWVQAAGDELWAGLLASLAFVAAWIPVCRGEIRLFLAPAWRTARRWAP